jgi:hypothetical protein
MNILKARRFSRTTASVDPLDQIDSSSASRRNWGEGYGLENRAEDRSIAVKPKL